MLSALALFGAATSTCTRADAGPSAQNSGLLSTQTLALSAKGAQDYSLSPDGRWLAWSEVSVPRGRKGPDNSSEPRVERIGFVNLSSKRIWRVGLSQQPKPTNYPWHATLRWRPDSRACAIASWEGCRIAWPWRRHSRRISLLPAESNDMAWAPRSNRLALFEDESGPGRIWDGRRLSPAREWVASTGYPYPGEALVWQAGWSPDERLILLRFYGHAERNISSAGHMALLDARSGRPIHWGAEAGPAAWLDSKRLIYKADDDGLEGAVALTVAKPRAHIANPWLPDVLAWTLSADRKVIWALQQNGDLRRSPSTAPRWELVRRKVFKLDAQWGFYPMISASPRGDMVAITNDRGGSGITLVGSSARRAWASTWRAPSGTVQLLGWARGHTLPLLEWQSAAGGPPKVVQLARP